MDNERQGTANVGAQDRVAAGPAWTLRDRLQRECGDAINRGAQEDARASRLRMLLDRLTPEHEELFAILGEMIALGVSPFPGSVIHDLAVTQRLNAERERERTKVPPYRR